MLPPPAASWFPVLLVFFVSLDRRDRGDGVRKVIENGNA